MEKIVQPLGMNRTFFNIPKELHDEVCCINEYDRERVKKEQDRNTARQELAEVYIQHLMICTDLVKCC